MDSSSSWPGRSSEPRNNKWANIVGTVIAIATLTLPPTIITYYSANNVLEALWQTPSITRADK